jgi:WD40 repeat protein
VLVGIFAVFTVGGTWVFIMILNRPVPLAILSGHGDFVLCVAFSPDGNTIASGSVDRTARLWDVATRTEQRVIREHEGMVFSVAFSPDNKRLATASVNGTIKIWDLATGEQLANLCSPANPAFSSMNTYPMCVAFSPDGTCLASGMNDGTVRLWDVDLWDQQMMLGDEACRIISLAFLPDRRTLASRSQDGKIKFWDTVNGKESMSLPMGGGIGYMGFRLALSPDGTTLAYNYPPSRLTLWDISTGEEVGVLKPKGSTNIQSMAFSPDGSVLAAVANSGLAFWDVESRSPIRNPWIGDATSFAISPDGKILASGGWKGSLRLWDMEKLLRR